MPSSGLMCYPCTVESKSDDAPENYRVRYATTVGPIAVGQGQAIAVPLCNYHVPGPQKMPTREELLKQAAEQAEQTWRALNPGQEPPIPDSGILKPQRGLVAATGEPLELDKFRGGKRD